MRTAIISTVAGVTALTGVGIGATPALAASASASRPAANRTGTGPATCATGSLPGYLQGSPTGLEPVAPAGDYVWHSAEGWHLAVTHPGHRLALFTGEITATNPIRYTPVHLEHSDVVRQSADRRTLWFAFTNAGYLDGLVLRADCSRVVRFSFQVDGHETSPAAVFLGANRVRSTSDPFTVERAGRYARPGAPHGAPGHVAECGADSLAFARIHRSPR